MGKALSEGEGIYKFSGCGVIFKSIYSFLFCIIFSFLSFPSLAQITTFTDGTWNSGSTWTGGTIPSETDDAVINHNVTINPGTTVEINNLSIGSAGKLTVEGTLFVYGNLIMANNDPELNTGSESSIFIFGNAVIANKVNLNLTSYFITLGDFTISGGGATVIEIDNASIYVFGDFDGGSTELYDCDDYDNLTENDSVPCHIGTEIAFEANVDANLIPPEILDLINECSTIDVFITEPAEICNAASGVANYLSYEVTTEVAFVVNMTAGDVSFNSTWEISFILTPAVGANLSNVSDGSDVLVDDSGTYKVTGLTSQSGIGLVTISMDVTGDLYEDESVTMEIIDARELECNTTAFDESRWIAVQIINAIPETSDISTD